MKILGTGLSGLIGTRIIELLGEKHSFEDLSLETGVDITDKQVVEQKVKQSGSKVILHMAAITDVDACDIESQKLKVKSQKYKSQKYKGKCWRVNVEGTRNIAEAAKKYKKKLIYISTEFVFDGEKKSYTEKDQPNPINWYGQTKYEGEKIAQETLNNYLILRFAFPYRAQFKREDIARFFISRLKRGEKVKAIDNWIITPTFIDDIAKAIDFLVYKDKIGVFHIVGSSSHTPLKMAEMISKEFNLDKTAIKAVKLNNLFAGKARRPKRLVVKNDKITRLGVKMRTFKEGLEEIKSQL